LGERQALEETDTIRYIIHLAFCGHIPGRPV